MRLVLALVLLAVLVTGCTRSADGEDSPRRGGVLRMGMTALDSLDPAQARTVESTIVADLLFDSLTAYHPTTLEPVPAVAARWTSTPDLRQWDFHVRGDAEFANGRPIGAGDVKYSLERVARRGSGSPGTALLEIVNGYPAFGRDGTAPDLAGITTPAPDVVRFSLDQPWAEWPSVLASPLLGIVPREAVEAVPPARPFAEAPIGSGPFELATATPERVSLAAARSGVLLDGIELVEFADVGAAYAAFERKDVDWARVPPAQVEAAGVRHGRRGYVAYAAGLYYGFNLRSPKLADSRVRQALLLAVDRPAVSRSVYGSTVRALDGIIPRGLPGYQADACGPLCAHDTELARQLLAEARPGQGPLEISIDFEDDPAQQEVATALKEDLSKAGVVVTLRPKPLAEYQQFVLSGQQELFRLGWIAPYPSPDAFLAPLFASGAPSNLAGHSVPAVDDALRLARTESDPVKRTALHQAAERAVMSSLPVIPMAQLLLHTVASRRVRDLRPTALGTFDGSAVWLAGSR